MFEGTQYNEVELIPPMDESLTLLNFRAETHPNGVGIDLIWDIPLILKEDQKAKVFAENPDANPILLISRRECRFPGKDRQGVKPVAIKSEALFPFPLRTGPSHISLISPTTIFQPHPVRWDVDGTKVYDSTTFRYDVEEIREEWEGDRFIRTSFQYSYEGESKDRPLVRTIRYESIRGGNGDSPVLMTVRFTDRQGLQSGVIYYYTAYLYRTINDKQAYWFSRDTQASALATGQKRHSLFAVLPQIHQQLDTAKPPADKVVLADRDKGQLQRLLEVFDAHADMLHGFIDGHRLLHNVQLADSRLLQHLAHLICWRLKDFEDEEEQRDELGLAPEIYKTTGTIPTIRAMFKRFTRGDIEIIEIKEFAHNVLRSVDTRRLEQRELGKVVYLDGKDIIAISDLKAKLPGSLRVMVEIGGIRQVDHELIFNLKNKSKDDCTAYTYDCGRLIQEGEYQLDDIITYGQKPHGLYNQKTIGIYVTLNVLTEGFSIREETHRFRKAIAEFLPIQVRPIFILELSYTDGYETLEEIKEEWFDVRVQWRLFITNRRDRTTVDLKHRPLDTGTRTWHNRLHLQQ